MDNHKDQFSIVKMSKVLEVSRSGYYRWRGRGPSERALENKRLKDRIQEIWEDSYRTYGSPRIHEQLQKEGEAASRPRVARLMKKMGIQSQISSKWTSTTDSNHSLPVATNLLEQDFTAGQLGQRWVSDIIYKGQPKIIVGITRASSGKWTMWAFGGSDRVGNFITQATLWQVVYSCCKISAVFLPPLSLVLALIFAYIPFPLKRQNVSGN